MEAIRDTVLDIARRLKLPDGHPEKRGIMQDMMQAMECYGPEQILREVFAELSKENNDA